MVSVIPLDGHSQEELLERAATLEARSPHPLAKAIVEQGARRGIEMAPTGDVQRTARPRPVADTVRPEAARMGGDLRSRGVQHLIMLTGDNRATAEAIARRCINEVHAQLLP